MHLNYDYALVNFEEFAKTEDDKEVKYWLAYYLWHGIGVDKIRKQDQKAAIELLEGLVKEGYLKAHIFLKRIHNILAVSKL
ncbi:34065_t:CDS:2 [Gigaspora margarita]|uniref:34065_t:CDS:1 n=1 Tax=Gigaspora margarita TaxID=4874 RepID=A0ABN7UUK5_GIGMA|nr:34065_t:CDS:2 [Gigaspora margarita]